MRLRPSLLLRPLMLAIVAALLAGCGGFGNSGGNRTISWVADAPTADPYEQQASVADAQDADTSGEVAAAPAPASQAPRPFGVLAPQHMREFRPNEVGQVFVLEYHVITTDPEQVEQFVRLADDMRAELQWLYENDFYVISLSDLVDNTIDIPVGKHPVVFTFDDGTSSQFRYLEDKNGKLKKDENGEYIIDPDCAVGILEAFFEEHPDFGRGGHFAPLIFNAFAYPEFTQNHLFDHKVKWLVENGYEVGNHTATHEILTDISDEAFMRVVAEPMAYFNDLIGADHPGNASDILTLPFGTTPDPETKTVQREMMRNGWEWEGEHYQLRGALLVGANPTVPPDSTDWDPLWIPRVQMFDEAVEYWWNVVERRELDVYTSDGDPNTVAWPEDRAGMDYYGTLNAAQVESTGRTLVPYSSKTGESEVEGTRPPATPVPAPNATPSPGRDRTRNR